MTDLYEALRAAMTPDGRVRMTRELLTAMHEEGERRERGEAVGGPVFVVARDVTFSPVDASVALMCERAETAERELEGAEREADEQRERRKRAEVERDAAHERAQKAERERDEALARIKAAGDVVSDNGCDCACDHSTLQDHDEDCEVCVVCRVADALWPEAGR